MLIYIIYHNIIWTAIISALVGAAVVFLVFFLRGKKKKGEAKPSANNLIIEGIKNNAGDFQELYEPIYSVAAGKNKKQEAAFKAFEDAANNCADGEFAAAYLEKFGGCENWGVSKKGKAKAKTVNKAYAKKARALVKVFFKAGLVREREIYVIGDETTAEKYEIVGGGIESGAEYEVLAPYWHLGNDIVDKGVIR